MKLVYFDEVKYKPNEQPYYWLGAIVVTPEMVFHLENAMNTLSNECFGSQVLKKETEFHAAEIFHRKSNFKSWKDINERMNVIIRLADILDSQEGLAKIYVKMDTSKIYANTSVEDMAFMFLVEKAEKYLRAQKSPGMLVGDKENDKVSKQFAETLSHYRESGTNYQFGMELTHLIDTVHFTNSHHSRMLQLADLYVWLNQLCSRSDPSEHPASLIIEHVKNNTDILNPQKYKIWPSVAS
ncbi:MAG: transporter [Alphaproteobacteria bacterium CG11_big_fil_rev_8_21_14_0_20_44_7]|nr:MAG: transporter [Alphaproteobacteria bacterium CG11_big_fil_rev_8_21_14_0_20_44_7]